MAEQGIPPAGLPHPRCPWCCFSVGINLCAVDRGSAIPPDFLDPCGVPSSAPGRRSWTKETC